MSSFKIIQNDLRNHIQNSNDVHIQLRTDISMLKKDIDNKISKGQFMWIIGLILALLGGSFWYLTEQSSNQFIYLTTQLENLRNISTNEANAISLVQQDVSSMKGKLDPYNVQFKD